MSLTIINQLISQFERNQSITFNDINKWTENIISNPKNELAINMITLQGIEDSILSHKTNISHRHTYSHQLNNEVKPITSQNQTGTCWFYAALNVIRIPFMKHYKLKSFEFSQAYLFFWDKIERANYFLEQIIDTCMYVCSYILI